MGASFNPSNPSSYALYAGTNEAIRLSVNANRGKSRPNLNLDAYEVKTLSTRGSFLPVLIGRRRIEPIFAWVGARAASVTQQRAGGKGSQGGTTGGAQSTSYTEGAAHLLCVGPASSLHTIWVSGKIVFEGPITPDDTPSGSSETVDGVGTFTIYWGEDTQPVNTFLSSQDSMAASRWPQVCYIVWEDFQLGSNPSWPVVSYEVECIPDPAETLLDQTPATSDNVPGPGTNLAHAVGQILFAPFPRGLGRDSDRYNLQSLENVGLAVSAPSAAFLPAPASNGANVIFNYDVGDPTKVTADSDGYVSVLADSGPYRGTANVDLEQTDASFRPVYYDGEGTTPQGLTDFGLTPVNDCPGIYFKSTESTFLEATGGTVAAAYFGEVLVLVACTLLPEEDTLPGASARVGALFGGWYDRDTGDDLVPDTTENTDEPQDAGGFHVAASLGSDGSNTAAYYKAAVVEEDSPSNLTGVAQIQAIKQAVTVVVAGRIRSDGAGGSTLDVSVSTVNGRALTSASTTAELGIVNRLCAGAYRPGMSQQDYYANAVIHQIVGLNGTPTTDDIDLYMDWLARRWAICAGNPDSRAFSTNLVIPEGQSGADALSSLFSDGSMGMAWDTELGQYSFEAFRASTNVVIVPQEYSTGRPDRVETTHYSQQRPKIVYSFVDKEHGYQKQTITIDSDGVGDLESSAQATEVNLPTVVDFDSAEAVSARRALELLDVQNVFRIELNHEGRIYKPGTVLSLPDYNVPVRVIELTLTDKGQGRSGNARLVCVPDVYGVSEYFYVAATTGNGGVYGQPTDPSADVAFGIFELPEELLTSGPSVVVPRIRASGKEAFASVYLSPDDVGFIGRGVEFDFQTGGTLDIGIAADDPWIMDEGPTITIQGPPDNVILQDLSSLESYWQRGEQLCLIGDEVFFLKKLTALGGLSFRLDGLIRARYDTSRQVHSAGAQVFLLRPDQILKIVDPGTLLPQATVYAKTQPTASTPLSLASVTSVSRTLYGKGTRPMPPVSLRKDGNLPTYRTGEDIDLVWDYRVVGAGAGIAPAGQATSVPPTDCTFEVEILDGAFASVVRSVTGLTSPAYSYTNANLVSDLGSEVTVGVRIYCRRNGYLSDAIQTTFALSS